jgi:hypothetical protein
MEDEVRHGYMMKKCTPFWFQRLKEKYLSQDLDEMSRWEDNIKVDFREIEFYVWTGFIWLRIHTCGRFFDHDNESSGSLKYW